MSKTLVSSSKNLSMFKQLINTKMEPILCSGVFLKMTKKKNESERFCVATKAALHITKNGPVTKSLKKCDAYGWIDLRKFSLTKDSFTFTFQPSYLGKEVSILLTSADSKNFLKEVLTFIKFFLPSNHPFFKNATIPTNIIGEDNEKIIIHNHYLELFISACYSYDIDTEQVSTIFSTIKHQIKEEHLLIVNSKQYKDDVIQALCLALEYTSTIPRLKIGGKNFSHFYTTLEKILKSNRYITRLHLYHYEKDEHFGDFFSVLTESTIKELIFERISLSHQMAILLFKNFNETEVNQLSFINCSLGPYMIQLLGSASSFQKLSKFAIDNDKTIQSDDTAIYTSIIEFAAVTSMTSLYLTNLSLEVSNIFRLLTQQEAGLSPKLTTIDISGCKFQAGLSDTYVFPPTIHTIIMRNVKWNVENLIRFLGKQEFQNMVELDFSSAQMKDKDFDLLSASLPIRIEDQIEAPSPMVSAIIWDSNPINPSLLKFFSMFKLLKKISLNECFFNRNESNNVLVGLKEMLTKSVEIVDFSIKRTMRTFKTKFIKDFSSVFMNHPHLKKLDVSYNAIGDDGVELLFDIIKHNSNITNISFDGSEVVRQATLLSFYKSLSALDYLEGVSKPNEDWRRFSSGSKKGEKELQIYWGKIEKCLKKNKGAQEAGSAPLEISSATNSTFFSLQSDSQSLCDNNAPPTDKSAILIATWNVLDDADMYSSPQEWDRLREDFSFSKIMSSPK